MAVKSIPVCALSQDHVQDWREAVCTATNLLVDLGVANADYPQACIASVEKTGPYIVLTKGVALAHAQVETGSTTEGISLLRLTQPITFGHPANDPVDLIFAFSSSGGDAHIAMIRRFGRALASGLPARARQAEQDQLNDLLTSSLAND